MEKKNVVVELKNPVTGELIYDTNFEFSFEISKDYECGEFEITTNEEGEEVVKITASNKEQFCQLLVRVVEDLTELVFFSAFEEYNKIDTTLFFMECDIEKRFGIELDAIKANIRYQILDQCGAFE